MHTFETLICPFSSLKNGNSRLLISKLLQKEQLRDAVSIIIRCRRVLQSWSCWLSLTGLAAPLASISFGEARKRAANERNANNLADKKENATLLPETERPITSERKCRLTEAKDILSNKKAEHHILEMANYQALQPQYPLTKQRRNEYNS